MKAENIGTEQISRFKQFTTIYLTNRELSIGVYRLSLASWPGEEIQKNGKKKKKLTELYLGWYPRILSLPVIFKQTELRHPGLADTWPQFLENLIVVNKVSTEDLYTTYGNTFVMVLTALEASFVCIFLYAPNLTPLPETPLADFWGL